MAETNAGEDVVRAFYAARRAQDVRAIRDLLAADVGWHEPGDEDYSGSHRGREAVVELLDRLRRATDGTFALEPVGFMSSHEHVVAKIRWSARRGDTHVSGNEIAVYRIAADRIAEAWFHIDGYDPQALSEVFSLRDH